MNLNKNAQVEGLVWIAVIMFIIIPMLAIYVFAFELSSRYADTDYGIEAAVLMKALVYNPKLLAYEDTATGRVYPGLIDASKFSTNWLEKSIENSNYRIAVNLELKDFDTNEIKKAYVNQERARAWDGWVYLGGIDTTVLQRHVQIYDSGDIKEGFLRIKVFIRDA